MFRHLTLKKSRKIFITEYITDVRNIINKNPLWQIRKVKQTQVTRKHLCLLGYYISTKCSWKEGDIFKKYPRNLNIPQIIFWICHVKIHFQNAMSMISWFLSKFNVWNFKSNKFDLKHKTLYHRSDIYWILKLL